MTSMEFKKIQTAIANIAAICKRSECLDCPLLVIRHNIYEWGCMANRMTEARIKKNIEAYKTTDWEKEYYKKHKLCIAQGIDCCHCQPGECRNRQEYAMKCKQTEKKCNWHQVECKNREPY